MLAGRLAEPTEIAGMITFLVSPFAARVIGSDHRVDGGAVTGEVRRGQVIDSSPR